MDYKSKQHGYLFIDYDEVTENWIAVTTQGDELTSDDFSEFELKEIAVHLTEMRYDSDTASVDEYFTFRGAKND